MSESGRSGQETMRAMAYETYGGTEVLSETRLPLPKLGPGEVLVRVRCAAVNPVDWKIMAGGLDPLMDVVYPVVPGWDVAGTVEKVGIDVPEYAEGDEVIAYARKDYVHGGTFAEFVTVPVRALAHKPASLSWAEAAGLPLAGLTAYQLLTRLGTGKDDTVLIHGAAGGVGSLGVQIARSLGARVIGTASPATTTGCANSAPSPSHTATGSPTASAPSSPTGPPSSRTSSAGSVASPGRFSTTTAGTRPSPTRACSDPAANGSGSAPSAATWPNWAGSPTADS